MKMPKVDIVLPPPKEVSQPLHWRGVISDLPAEQRETFCEQEITDMHRSSCVTRIGVRSLSSLLSQVKSELCGFHFTGVGMLGQLRDSHVVCMARFVFHFGKDAAGSCRRTGSKAMSDSRTVRHSN